MSTQPSTSKDVEEYSSSEKAFTLKQKRRKRTYAQKYQVAWKQQQEFKGWLQKSKKGSTYAFCKICNKDLTCGKSELLRHSKVHTNKAKQFQKQQTLMEMSIFKTNSALDDDIKKAEIRMALILAEHNLPFNIIDHLSMVIRVSFSDSEIAKKYKNNRTKATSIVTNVTGAPGLENTVEIISKQKFSLIVDESTDKGSIKSLALVVRVFCNNSSKVYDLFLALLPVPNATAEVLYDKIVFSKHNIDYKKQLIGFGANGASAMMGAHNSLSRKLKNDIPNLFILKCTCHSFSLCAN